jgi:hypothetical protein
MMQSKRLELAVFLAVILALVVSVDIAPDAAGMLLARVGEDKAVRIENVFACVGGRSVAMVRNGPPDDVVNYDVVEAMGLTVYVPRSMSFENDIPRIVTYPRRTGGRGAGVSNTRR